MSEDHKDDRWMDAVSGFRQARSRAVIASLVCAMLLLAAGAAWLIAERTRLKKQIEQIQNERGVILIGPDGVVLIGPDDAVLTGADETGEALSSEELKQQMDQQRALNDELAQQLNQAKSKLDEKEQEIAKLKQANASNRTAVNASAVAMILAPELSRGEDESNPVYLSKGIDRLQLKLEVDGEKYKKYRAEVRTAEGEEILRSDNLKARASRRWEMVGVELAAKRFAKGDYIIVLSGANSGGDYQKISTYHFRVIRR